MEKEAMVSVCKPIFLGNTKQLKKFFKKIQKTQLEISIATVFSKEKGKWAVSLFAKNNIDRMELLGVLSGNY